MAMKGIIFVFVCSFQTSPAPESTVESAEATTFKDLTLQDFKVIGITGKVISYREDINSGVTPCILTIHFRIVSLTVEWFLC